MPKNLPSDEELAEIRKTHARAYEPWGDEEAESFKRDWERFERKEYGMPGMPDEFLAWAVAKYQRNDGAITARIKKVGGALPSKRVRKIKDRATIVHKTSKDLPEIDLNPQLQAVLEILNSTNDHLFITGRAGTGKSTLLNYFRYTTKKQVVVLAPTGVAALNVEGQTVHSFCSFPADITYDRVKQLKPWLPKRKLLQKLDTIVIDEISMVRADLLDCLDKFLRMNGKNRNEPFGGYQLVFIGDLYQLPPVESVMEESGAGLFDEYATPYFFDAHVFSQIDCRMVELEKIYRQKDHVFIDLLNAVRDNCATEEHLEQLNHQVNPDFQFEDGEFVVSLTTTNARAFAINQAHLAQLTGEAKKYRGRIVGEFLNKRLPTEEIVTLRVGAQVMMLNNDVEGRWVNGTMGKIIAFEKHPHKADTVVVELEDGTTQSVLPHTWEFFKYVLDNDTGTIGSQILGSFMQYPMKLAWAVTIHKSQGKTFSKVHIDLGTGTFAHGQLYVALSRCRTLQGITLQRPVSQTDIKLDPRIVDFMQRLNK